MPILRITDEANPETFTFEIKNEGKVTIGSDCTGSEEVDVQFWDGANFVTVFKNGNAYTLNADNRIELLDGPMIYRCVKPANVSLIVYVGSETSLKIRDDL